MIVPDLQQVALRAQLGVFVEFAPKHINVAALQGEIDRLPYGIQAVLELFIDGGMNAVAHAKERQDAQSA